MQFHSLSLGRILLSLSSLGTAVGAFLADVVTDTHIFNPRWTPHAKFHGGQTIAMSVVLGLMGLYLTWRRDPRCSAREQRQVLWDAFCVTSIYWVTQFAAGFVPGALATDPEFGEGNPQKYLQVGFLAMNALGYWYEAGQVKAGAEAGRGKDE
ncbi:MAG: hypothetical protein LQ340_002888 [Diploschistes diacapsis]|nr:MAG: hypothetical protein LQ340_002888 [Diploschistes diacapsis]